MKTYLIVPWHGPSYEILVVYFWILNGFRHQYFVYKIYNMLAEQNICLKYKEGVCKIVIGSWVSVKIRAFVSVL